MRDEHKSATHFLKVALAIPFLLQMMPAYPQSPANHALRLIGPSDDAFESMIATFPGLTAQPAFNAIKPFFVFVENDTALRAKAYCIDWMIVTDTGVVGHQQKLFIQKHYMLPNSSKHLGPSETRLVTPWFILTPEEYKSARYLNSFFAISNPPGSAHIKSVVATVDGVVFSDNTFAGPNQGGLLEQFIATRHGEHDEGISIQRSLQAQKTTAEIISQLDSDIRLGVASAAGRDSRSFYLVSRGKEAESLKNLFVQNGLAALSSRAATMAGYPPENITRVSEP